MTSGLVFMPDADKTMIAVIRNLPVFKVTKKPQRHVYRVTCHCTQCSWAVLGTEVFAAVEVKIGNGVGAGLERLE